MASQIEGGLFLDYNKNMDTKQQKINMWKKQAEDLQNQLSDTMKKRGKAAQEGDLSENAAYKGFTEEAEMISARLNNIQKIIQELEGGN